MKKIKSIEEIINDYDNFIIDQWGVMHDGTFGYDHAFNSINILCIDSFVPLLRR